MVDDRQDECSCVSLLTLALTLSLVCWFANWKLIEDWCGSVGNQHSLCSNIGKMKGNRRYAIINIFREKFLLCAERIFLENID